jgi:O-antigen ligase
MYLGAFGLLFALFAITAQRPIDLVFSLNFSMLFLFAPIAWTLTRSADRRNIVLVGWLALTGLALALGMMVIQELRLHHRLAGFNIGPIVLANGALALAVIAMMSFVAQRDRRSWWLLLAPLLALGIVLITRSRGPLVASLPLFVVTAVALWRTRFRSRWFAVAMGVLFVAGTVVAFVVLSRRGINILEIVERALGGRDTGDSSSRARLALYAGGVHAFLDSPWVGHGWARLMTAVAPYLAGDDQQYARRLPQLHNDVLNFAVAGGVAGVVAYFGILLTPLVAALRSARDSLYGARVYGTLALVVVYAAAGLTDLMFGHEFHTALYVSLSAIILGFCRDAPMPPRQKGQPLPA